LIDALKSTAQIYGILKTGEGAKYAEEAYNLMLGQHGPEHMESLISVTSVIDCCVDARNFADAERFFLSDLFFLAKKMKFQQNQE
jgi:pentatricopeptide repeat protein